MIGAVLSGHRCVTEDAVIAVATEAAAVLVESAPMTRRVIEHLGECRVISKFGVGVDNIDLQAAADRDIIVTHVPDYCVDEVADHTLTLALMLLRRTAEQHRAVRGGAWPSATIAHIPRLRDSTWGIIGYGRTGRAVAARARVLGCRILAYDPALSPEEIACAGAEAASLDEVAAHSDIVSLHATYRRGEPPLIDSRVLACMQPAAVIVNTARGRLIDERALTAALDAGAIAGAGLDVLSIEPPPSDHPLRTHPGVVLTPHSAWFSAASMTELRSRGIQAAIDVLSGRAPRNALPLPEPRRPRPSAD